MKKLGFILLVLVVISIIIAVSPGIREELHWRWASYNNNIKNYENYIKSWPNGRHVAQAKNGIDELHWEKAERSYTIVAFERYLSKYPAGKYATKAKTNIVVLRSAANQDTRPIEGTIETVDKTTGTLKIKTSMDELEELRLTDDTQVEQEGEKRTLDDLSETEGLRIEYVNLPGGGGILLAKKILMGYTVSHCSCGSSCTCPLDKGCRVIEY